MGRALRGPTMTEADWLAATDPEPMLYFLKGKVSDRKLRLFAAACCRRVLHAADEDEKGSVLLVQLAERHADGRAGEAELTGVPAPEFGSGRPFETAARLAATAGNPAWNAADAAKMAGLVVGGVAYAGNTWDARIAIRAVMTARRREAGGQAVVLRDIFGDPFRPVPADPSWLTSTVVTLARQMYESRDFGAMPILADALMDAGCSGEGILDHCRGDGPHVRGCWVVDLVLGKE